MRDKFFILNVASFYKINLLDKLSSVVAVSALFLDDVEIGRHEDFFSSSDRIESMWWCRFRVFTKVQMLTRMGRVCRNKEIILGGWDRFVFWLIVFNPFIRKRQLSLILESSVNESAVGGVKGFIKRIFLRRISTVYASGRGHGSLVLELGFSGRILTTKGVGVLENEFVPDLDYRQIEPLRVKASRMLYVGRLSEEKNLEFLIHSVSRLGIGLDIIGDGDKYECLLKLAKNLMVDVRFLGHKSRSELPGYYRDYNYRCLVLTSYRETWGLVVEEAVAYGLPVIVTERAGCYEDFVLENAVGLGVNPLDGQSLDAAILKMFEVDYYAPLLESVLRFSTKDKERYYVERFLS